jgi:cytochrome c6
MIPQHLFSSRISSLRVTVRLFVGIGVLVLAASQSSVAQTSGQSIYKSKCQTCHGATGAADTPTGKALKAIPFADPEVAKMSDAALMDIIENGKGPMPAFKGTLQSQQIKAVISYIHTLEKTR